MDKIVGRMMSLRRNEMRGNRKCWENVKSKPKKPSFHLSSPKLIFFLLRIHTTYILWQSRCERMGEFLYNSSSSFDWFKQAKDCDEIEHSTLWMKRIFPFTRKYNLNNQIESIEICFSHFSSSWKFLPTFKLTLLYCKMKIQLKTHFLTSLLTRFSLTRLPTKKFDNSSFTMVSISRQHKRRLVSRFKISFSYQELFMTHDLLSAKRKRKQILVIKSITKVLQ